MAKEEYNFFTNNEYILKAINTNNPKEFDMYLSKALELERKRELEIKKDIQHRATQRMLKVIESL